MQSREYTSRRRPAALAAVTTSSALLSALQLDVTSEEVISRQSLGAQLYRCCSVHGIRGRRCGVRRVRGTRPCRLCLGLCCLRAGRFLPVSLPAEAPSNHDHVRARILRGYAIPVVPAWAGPLPAALPRGFAHLHEFQRHQLNSCLANAAAAG